MKMNDEAMCFVIIVTMLLAFMLAVMLATISGEDER